jgi:drug/metabolite transporter (DMT)-like permease
VFILFARIWLRETPRWNERLAMGLVFVAVLVAVLPGRARASEDRTEGSSLSADIE